MFHPIHIPIKDRFTENKIIIDWVGHITKATLYNKNIETIIKAIDLFPKSIKEKFHLEFVGLLEMYIDTHLQKKYPQVNTHFLGMFPREELPCFYSNFSIFIFPSRQEGSPKALLEALTCGCLIIVNNTEELMEIMQHNKNGLVIDCTDPMKLKNAIYELMKDLAKRIRLMNNAFQISKKYDKTTLLKKEVEFIKNIFEY